MHQCICINFHLTATTKGSLKDTILGVIRGFTIQDKLCIHTLVPRPCWSLWYQGNRSKGVVFYLDQSKICQHTLCLHFTHTGEATFCLLYPRLASWGLAGFWQMYYQYISLQKLRFQMCVFWKAFKLKTKCRCLLISVTLLISSYTKPYLLAELTLENLSAVLASFTYRLEHVPENAM